MKLHADVIDIKPQNHASNPVTPSKPLVTCETCQGSGLEQSLHFKLGAYLSHEYWCAHPNTVSTTPTQCESCGGTGVHILR